MTYRLLPCSSSQHAVSHNKSVPPDGTRKQPGSRGLGNPLEGTWRNREAQAPLWPCGDCLVQSDADKGVSWTRQPSKGAQGSCQQGMEMGARCAVGLRRPRGFWVAGDTCKGRVVTWYGLCGLLAQDVTLPAWFSPAGASALLQRVPMQISSTLGMVLKPCPRPGTSPFWTPAPSCGHASSLEN